MISSVRRWLIGPPLPTERMRHERLGKAQALAVLSSDALSSTAYATEEILLVLVLAGTGAIHLSLPLAAAISALLFIVASSYYQTVHAYPQGGGAYLVTKDNLGRLPSLVAGAALLIDYVLTVAVSISAGVAAITSAFPVLYPERVGIALLMVAFITVVNLRGVRETGRVFALPTYFFIASMYLLIIVGLYRVLTGTLPEPQVQQEVAAGAVQNLTLFLILRAFASGCTALTGIEAIADGVPVFKPPEADNAGKTLLVMVTLLSSIFLGITFLSRHFMVTPKEGETVVSQIARLVFDGSPLYYLLQFATALILFLAANTSYSDFPRLSMWMARDGFLPRQFANLGDRLVYSNGILALGTLASLLIVIFGANTHALIPLYAVGVFISFTLSQTSMVLRWSRLRVPGWQIRAFFNGIGALATGVVMVIIASTKFVHGAWIVLLLIPLFVRMFLAIREHYDHVAEQLTLEARPPAPVEQHTVIVPIGGVHRGVVKAMYYARALGGTLKPVYIDTNPERTAIVKEKWQKVFPDVDLVIIPSPYRSVLGPLVEFIDGHIQEEGHYVTVVIPEFVPAKWWHNLLHNQTAWALRVALLYRRNWQGRFRILTSVPFYLAK